MTTLTAQQPSAGPSPEARAPTRLASAIAYGGDYNPEQWPEEVWENDVSLMAEAGVNLVTVGVFSWARLQPGPGRPLDAGWLDRVLDRLAGAGIGVDLATATASPPHWLVEAHPEILPTTAGGVRLSTGSRQHYCPSSVAYRDAATDLVRRLAARYGKHPALRLWHVNNEYGCHVPACYCDASAAAFRAWLRHRYGDLESLGDAWGTAFWSQGYSSWEQVLPPRRAPTFPNPGSQLDFARFSSDELLACFLAERAVLAEVTPDVPVTTNLMGLFRPVDGWAWAARQSVVSVDSYPDPADPEAHVGAALVADLTRSLGGGRPWVLMEQAPGAVNWRHTNAAKARGQFRTWSLQAVGRGADAILSFQWRASAAGAEKFHSAMVPHAGTDSRGWRQAVALGADLARLGDVVGTRVEADVAILVDWESWWALELDSHPSGEVVLAESLLEVYRPLFDSGVAVDFAHPDTDLGVYRLVIAPNLYLVSDGAAAALDRHVYGGGTAVVTYFSGIVDPADHVRLGGYPAPWRDLLGLRVEEFAPLPVGGTVALDGALAAGPGAHGRCWQEWIDLHGATALLRFAAGPLTGWPAATVHDHGRGGAFYLGTLPDRETLARVLRQAWQRAGVSPAMALPPGVEASRRGGHLFVVNHNDVAVEVEVKGSRRDLLTGSTRSGPVTIGPGGAVVLAPSTIGAVP